MATIIFLAYLYVIRVVPYCWFKGTSNDFYVFLVLLAIESSGLWICLTVRSIWKNILESK